MAKSVLCVIDFSDSALQVVNWAAELSLRFNCRLQVLYPYRLLQAHKGEEVMLIRKKAEEAARKFAEIENNVLKEKNVSFDFSAEVGFLFDRIEDRMRKDSTILIVIGRNMSLSAKDSFDDLISHAKVPLVIVP